MSEEEWFPSDLSEAAIDAEIKRHDSAWKTDWLEEQKSKLGIEEYDKQLPKLLKQADKALKQHKADIEAIHKKDEEIARQKAAKAAKSAAILRQWENPTHEFLNQQLLKSRKERTRTLTYYLMEAYPALRRRFQIEFTRWILNRLDKLEKRKLKD